MTKILKIGIPILVLVFALGVVTGLVLAKGNDASVVAESEVAYAADYAGCSQCPGTQLDGCPYAGNGCYCAGVEAGCGRGELNGDSNDSYLPSCHRYR